MLSWGLYHTGRDRAQGKAARQRMTLYGQEKMWNVKSGIFWGGAILLSRARQKLRPLVPLFGHEGFIDDRSHVGSLHVQWEMLSEK